MRIPPCSITASRGLSSTPLRRPESRVRGGFVPVCSGARLRFRPRRRSFGGPRRPKPSPFGAKNPRGGRVKKQGAGPNSRNRPRGYGRTGAAQGTPRGLLAEERGQRSPGAGLWASLCARSPAAHGPGPPAAAKRERRSPNRGRRARDGRIRAGSTSCTGGHKLARSASLPRDRKAAFRPRAKRSGSGRPADGVGMHAGGGGPGLPAMTERTGGARPARFLPDHASGTGRGAGVDGPDWTGG